MVKRELQSWNETFSLESMPHDPIAFSYWVVSSLPLEDSMKLTLLAVNSAIQRLRAELHIMRAVGLLVKLVILWPQMSQQSSSQLWDLIETCGITFFKFKVDRHQPYAFHMLFIYRVPCPVSLEKSSAEKLHMCASHSMDSNYSHDLCLEHGVGVDS